MTLGELYTQDVLACMNGFHVMQDARLTPQLSALEARLASLTGEDEEATTDELAHCRHVLQTMSGTLQPSTASQEAADQAREAQPVAVQQDRHQVAAPPAPLLLGPP